MDTGEVRESQTVVALDGIEYGQAMELALCGRGAFRQPSLIWGTKVNAIGLNYEIPIIRELIKYRQKLKLFVDFKNFDTVKTVRDQVRIASSYADIMTVHAAGGYKMLTAAVETAKNYGTTRIVAITVLTDWSENQCKETYGDSIEVVVNRFANWAYAAGCWGIVCAPKDLEYLKNNPNTLRLAKVVANIRPDPKIYPVKNDSQNSGRSMTPKEAARAGSTLQVIGRPIVENRLRYKPEDMYQDINTDVWSA